MADQNPITVYKVVKVRGNERVSAVISNELRRIYMEADGTLPVVPDALCFGTIDDAVWFGRTNMGTLGWHYEIYRATAESARDVKLVTQSNISGSFMTEFWANPTPSSRTSVPPHGTILCTNVQLQERVYPAPGE